MYKIHYIISYTESGVTAKYFASVWCKFKQQDTFSLDRNGKSLERHTNELERYYPQLGSKVTNMPLNTNWLIKNTMIQDTLFKDKCQQNALNETSCHLLQS